MDMVADSSCLISLARAGLLSVVPRLPVSLIVLDQVWTETVVEGRSRGHADALAIESVLGDLPRLAAAPVPSVDAAVLAAAVDVGALVANDLTLGRRARNLGVLWLRTVDLLVVGARRGTLALPDARDGVVALRDSGRITVVLADHYLEVLA